MNTPKMKDIGHMSMGDGVGRGAAIGAAIGFVAFSAFAAGVGLFAGMDMAPAAGVGAFVGIWGGPGFGAMMGGIFAVTRDERALAKLD
jgi:hypothetical protein